VAQKADDASRAVSRGRGMILLVDDEEMIRAMASEMLAALGYSVVVSSDGQDALEYYKNHARKIDLVVLDIVMPRLGGFDCFMAMKAINPKIRALAFSGYVINDEVKRMLAEGARGFLHKPFDMKSLSTAIQNALD
jgi:CheY-like chemotaxis protein